MSVAKISPLPRTEMDALLLGRLDELTVADSGSGGKNFLSILLSMIVLLIISSMIVAAIVIINPDITNFSSKQHTTREAITLDEALLGELSAKDFDFQWLPATNNDVGGVVVATDLDDQLLFEENKNIKLATMPPSERRSPTTTTTAPSPSNSINLVMNGSSQSTNNSSITTAGNISTSYTTANTNNNNQQQQQFFQLNVTTLVSNTSLLSSIEYQGYKISPSKRYLLIWTAKRKQFRHSFTAKYFLYDIKLDLISSLSTGPKLHYGQYQAGAFNHVGGVGGVNSSSDPIKHNQYEQLDSASLYLNDQIDSNDEFARFQLVDWYASESKQSLKPSDSLILIQNNDIYILNNVEGPNAESSSDYNDKLKRLTFNGRPNELFNGIADWLYEEEILGDAPAFQLSPSGARLAYMSFDDSPVDSMPFSFYGDLVIPRIQRIKYPKAGKPNPLVSVHLIDQLNGDDERRHHVELKLPSELQQQQHYINRIIWLTNSKLALVWSNRNQNVAQVLVCSSSMDWKCVENLQLEADGGWLDISDDLYPLDEEHYLALIPKFEGQDVGHFKHLAKVSLNQRNTYDFITSGRKDVLSINGVDNKRLLVYYTSTVVDEPGQRQLFVAELAPSSNNNNGRDQQSSSRTNTTATDKAAGGGGGVSVCITCDHYPSECLYNSPKVSPSTNYYIFQCDGPGIPRTELRATRRRRHRFMSSSSGQYKKQSKVLITNNQQLGSSSSSSSQGGSKGPNIEQKSVVTDQLLATNLHHHQGGGDDDEDPSLFHHDNNSLDSGNVSSLLGATTNGQENLLWIIEDNKELRRRLELTKAMPLTMRLKVPIPNTNYSANVLLLLPPLVSSATTFKASPFASISDMNHHQQQQQQQQHRPRRGASTNELFGHHRHSESDSNEQRQRQAPLSQQQPLHHHYTSETIRDYASQLPAGLQYPMVVDVYAGPGSQKVDYRFNVYFGHYLASSRRTIYAMIDGRGSGYQGTKRLYEIYRKFGTVEIQDQIDVAAYLARNLSFIDPAKMAIWGWSYGGYAAAMALAQSNARALQVFQAQLRSSSAATSASPLKSSIDLNELKSGLSTEPNGAGGGGLAQLLIAGRANAIEQNHRLLGGGGGGPAASHLLLGAPQYRGVFECAASVAPVTNWIYYDTAYTEKYMSSPWMNERYDLHASGDHLQSLSSLAGNDSTTDHEQQQQQEMVKQSPIGVNKWVPLNGTSIDSFASSNTILASSSTKFGRGGGANGQSNQADLNERYKRASLLEQIANVDRKRFLLIHGTADDNVHFQQSIMLMKRLIQKNVLFETRLYPDQDHSINNKADKLHLGSTLSNFFAECFDMAH